MEWKRNLGNHMVVIKDTVWDNEHRYRGHAITRYFTACEIIIKHNFTRVCRMYNK